MARGPYGLLVAGQTPRPETGFDCARLDDRPFVSALGPETNPDSPTQLPWKPMLRSTTDDAGAGSSANPRRSTAEVVEIGPWLCQH